MSNLKNRLSAAKVLGIAMIVAACFSVALSSARAQCLDCPDDSYGPLPSVTLFPWSCSSTYQIIPGTSCGITIYFCYRQDDVGATQIWIYAIEPDAGGPCDGLSNTTIIHAARDLVFNASGIVAGSPCFKDQPAQVVQVFNAKCWSMNPRQGVGGGQNQYGLYPCLASGWCRKTCDACYTFPGPVIHLSNCTYFGNEMSLMCDPAAETWIMGQCYTIGCE